MAGAVAITRAVSSGLAACELTYQARVSIDVEVARAQHREYERALSAAGYCVERLGADAAMPDSVFVEDMAVVFDEVAILTNPGAESRRRELPAHGRRAVVEQREDRRGNRSVRLRQQRFADPDGGGANHGGAVVQSQPKNPRVRRSEAVERPERVQPHARIGARAQEVL